MGVVLVINYKVSSKNGAALELCEETLKRDSHEGMQVCNNKKRPQKSRNIALLGNFHLV